jgi:hypothetical protein
VRRYALVTAAGGTLASLTASITPVVFLTHGPAITQAVAVIAHSMQAWTANALGFVVGRCKLERIACESDWVQPLNLSSEKLVSKSAFKMQRAPLHRGHRGGVVPQRGRGGAAQVESS